MKIYENGVLRDMTPTEIAEMEEARLRYEAEEKHRPSPLKKFRPCSSAGR